VLFSQTIFASNNTQKCFYKTPNGICITTKEVDVFPGVVTRVEYKQNKFLLLLHINNQLIGTVAHKSMLSEKLCNIANNISYIESESGENIFCK
jgi:hypothetical protein